MYEYRCYPSDEKLEELSKKVKTPVSEIKSTLGLTPEIMIRFDAVLNFETIAELENYWNKFPMESNGLLNMFFAEKSKHLRSSFTLKTMYRNPSENKQTTLQELLKLT